MLFRCTRKLTSGRHELEELLWLLAQAFHSRLRVPGNSQHSMLDMGVWRSIAAGANI
jgi:hypothetical protein